MGHAGHRLAGLKQFTLEKSRLTAKQVRPATISRHGFACKSMPRG
jgi:hypothetical protein